MPAGGAGAAVPQSDAVCASLLGDDQAVGRPVEVHAYADRVAMRQDGGIIASHDRCLSREPTIYNPWRYVPVLTRKPGALGRARQKLETVPDGDRQMVKVLAAALTEGLPAVEAACSEALGAGLCGSDVVLNSLSTLLITYGLEVGPASRTGTWRTTRGSCPVSRRPYT